MSQPVSFNKPIILGAILFVLILFCLFANFYLPQSKPENTALVTPTLHPKTTSTPLPVTGWQTYTNTQYGYSFDYPSDWIVDQADQSPSHNYALINSPRKSRLVSMVYDDSSKTIVDFLAKNDLVNQTDWEGGPSKKVLETKKTVVAGLNLIQRTEFLNAAGFQVISAYFKNNKRVFQLQLQPTNGEVPNSDDVEVFYQILSTFKFTTPITIEKPSISSPKLLDTSSWVPHSCNKITFKLPSDYTVVCNQDTQTDSTAVITPPGKFVSLSLSIKQYDGSSRRQWWIKQIGASSSEVSKYMRINEAKFGAVEALDVFGSSGWWQGGYASPIIVASGNTIVTVMGGRDFNDQTGKIIRWDLTDTIASTIKFTK